SNRFGVDPLGPQVDAGNRIQELTDSEDLIELGEDSDDTVTGAPNNNSASDSEDSEEEMNHSAIEKLIEVLNNTVTQIKENSRPPPRNPPRNNIICFNCGRTVHIAPPPQQEAIQTLLNSMANLNITNPTNNNNQTFIHLPEEDTPFFANSVTPKQHDTRSHKRVRVESEDKTNEPSIREFSNLLEQDKTSDKPKFKVAPEILNIKPLRITAPALMTSDNQNFNNNPKPSTDIPIFYSDYEKDDNNTFVDTKSVDFIEFTDFYSYNNDETVEQSFNIENLDPPHQIELENLLCNNSNVFAWTSNDLGRTGLTKHIIDTGDVLPIKQRPYRRSPKEKEYLKNEIGRMLRDKIIRPCCSPWASPVVLKDTYPLPHVDDLLDTLRGSCWYSSLDLASGYWQIEMKESDKEKTAFITEYRTFEFNIMPFSLANAPSTFQRLGVIGKFIVVYLDDINVFSTSFPEHLNHLHQVFHILRQAHLKLKPSKCFFAKKRLKFLGYVIGHRGISTDSSKIKVIREFPVPKNLRQLHGFLGLASYYHHFVNGFTKIAHSLNQLLRKDVTYNWGPSQQCAFKALKDKLSSSPILVPINRLAQWILSLQEFDYTIKHRPEYLYNFIIPSEFTLAQIKKLKHQTRYLFVLNDLLYKNNPKNPQRPRIILKEDEIESILYSFHSDPLARHFNVMSTYHKIAVKYFWPQMGED
ncbi:2224_t:CDS:2, partial [Dentiscutata heterogama]